MLLHHLRTAATTILALGLSLSLSHCAKHTAHKGGKFGKFAAPKHRQMASETIKVAAFDEVAISGIRNLNIQLIASTRDHDVRVVGHPKAIKQMKIKSADGKLHVYTQHYAEFTKPVLLVIRTNKLHALNYRGRGHLTVIDVNSPMLDLDIDSKGMTQISGPRVGLHKVAIRGAGPVIINGVNTTDLSLNADGHNDITLRGYVALRHLFYHGDGKFKATGIATPRLVVRGGGSGTIYLSGRVGEFDVILHDSIRLNARKLIGRRVFAKTYNRSVAELHSTHAQHVLASDASDIYFYKNSEFKADYMAYNGAVLDMTRIP